MPGTRRFYATGKAFLCPVQGTTFIIPCKIYDCRMEAGCCRTGLYPYSGILLSPFPHAPIEGARGNIFMHAVVTQGVALGWVDAAPSGRNAGATTA